LEHKTAIIGLGYVGLPLALLAKQKGLDVIGIDVDERKLKLINAGVSPFTDEDVTNALKSATPPLSVTSDTAAMADRDTLVVCVPTPVDATYTPDLGPVIGACTGIAKVLHKGQLVIIESTINPGVCDEIIVPLLEKQSGLTCGKDFYLAHCPERINPGDEKWHVGNIARVVGGYDPKSLQLAVAFYQKVITGSVKPMGSLKEAEAVKVVENSFRDVNIAFVNELAMSFTKLGIDVVNVIDGAATKPFAFMPHYPGAGVGGHCIPVDPYYLIEYAKKNGFDHKFLSIARNINNGMPAFVVERVAEALRTANLTLKGAKVAVLGLSYKPNVGDLRESPSLEIIDELKLSGADVAVHDPYVTKFDGAPSTFSGEVVFGETAAISGNDILQTIAGADAVIVATNHREYSDLLPDDFLAVGVKAVIDGRNCLNKDAFEASEIIYEGVGR
jgi:UDP-N-acetyl-D-glucosamine dehydrogenase